MTDVVQILKALADTPLPTLLVISGIFFLFVSFAEIINVYVWPEHRPWLRLTGGVFIIFGILLYVISRGSATNLIPTTTTPTLASTSTTLEATLIATPTRITPTPTIMPSPSPTVTIGPSPSATLDISASPVSIANPFCPRPLNLELRYPSNGSTVSGVIQIRGTVKPRNVGQWYSLFYRVGVVREEMDTLIQNRVPRDRTTLVSGNIPIEFYTFTNVPVITDSILGTWDTTTLSAGWYSLRLWLREIDSQFLACDVYVAVRK